MPILVSQPPPLGPGFALLTITGRAPLDPSSVRVAVEQPGTGRFMQTYGRGEPWGTTRTWIQPERAELDGVNLLLTLGPAQTWNLKANVTYIVHLSDASGEATGAERLAWRGVRMPSTPPDPLADLADVQTEPPVPTPAPVPPPVPPPDPPVVTGTGQGPATPVVPAPEPTAPVPEAPAKGGRGKLIPAIAATLALLVIGGGVALWQLGLPGAGSDSQAGPGMPAPVTGPFTVDAARAFLKGNPAADTAFTAGQAYLEDGAPDALQGALLIMTYAAQAGHPAAATSIGRMYDPETHSAERSPVATADPEKAFLWYERGRQGKDAEAMFRLGMLMIKGRVEGPGIGPEAGVRLLEEAAALGHAEAKAELGKPR